MPYRVLPVLVGTLIFSPTVGASNSKGNLETPKPSDREEASKQDPSLLPKVNALGVVFDDPEMGSSPYQPVN